MEATPNKEERPDKMKYPSAQRLASLHEGLFFGGTLGLVLLLNGVLDLLTGISAGTLIVTIVSIAIYLYAAVRATYVTGKLSTGLLAGFWTGLVSSAINLVVLATVCILVADTLRQRADTAAIAQGSSAHFTDAGIVGYDIGLLALGLLMAAACGLVCGTIGGMITIHRGHGRQVAKATHEV